MPLSEFITIENIPFGEGPRYNEIILILLNNNVFNIKNGEAVLRFDNLGILQEVEVTQKRYRRGKEALTSSNKASNIKSNT